MAMTNYQERCIKLIEKEFESGGDESGLCVIIDKVYEDGFKDGYNEGFNERLLELK